MNHPSRDTLHQFMEETLSEEEMTRVGTHLDSCDGTCEEALAEMAGVVQPQSDAAEVDSDLAEQGLRDLKHRLDLAEWPEETTTTETALRRQHKEGEGGISVVFSYWDEALQRRVAVKCLQLRKMRDEEAKKNFDREYSITSALDHPGVPPVYCRGTFTDGRQYFAMRFIGGETLAHTIARFHQSPEEQPLLSRQNSSFRRLIESLKVICETVDHAHGRNICHLDLKPGNVHVYQGETVVLDWGLAQRMQQGVVDPNVMKGLQAGTPEYMAPEQAAGSVEKIGIASDIFALGAILSEMLTGQLPRKGGHGETPPQFLARIASEPTPSKVDHPKTNVPPELASICLKAMAAEPQERYSSAVELREELDKWLTLGWVNAHPYTMPEKVSGWLQRHMAVAGTSFASVVLLALVATFAALLINQARRDEAGARLAELAAHRNTNKLLLRRQVDAGVEAWRDAPLVHSLPWFARSLTDFPELSAEDEPQIRLRLGATLRTCALPVRCWFERLAIEDIAISKDGERLMVRTKQGVEVRSVSSGEVLSEIQPQVSFTDAALSASGEFVITFEFENDFRLWDAATGQPAVKLATINDVHFDPVEPILRAAIDDDASHTLVLPERHTIRLWNIRTGEAVELWTSPKPPTDPLEAKLGDLEAVMFNPSSAGRFVLDACFTQAGKRVLAIDETGKLLEWEVATGKLIRATRLTTEINRVHVARVRTDGSAAALVDTNGNAWVFNAATEESVLGPINLDWRQAVDSQRPIVLTGRMGDTEMNIAFDPKGEKVAISVSRFEFGFSDRSDSRLFIFDYELKTKIDAPSRDEFPLEGSIRSMQFVGNRLLIDRPGQDLGLFDASDGADSPARLALVDRVSAVATNGTQVVTLSGDSLEIAAAAPAPGLPGNEPAEEPQLAPAGGEMEIRVWQPPPRLYSEFALPIESKADSVSFSPDGGFLAAISSVDGSFHLVGTSNGEAFKLQDYSDKPVENYTFSPAGDLLALFFRDGTVQGWELPSGKPTLGSFKTPGVIIEGQLDASAKWFVGLSPDKTAYLWDLKSNTHVDRFSMPNADKVFFVPGAPARPAILTGGTVYVWDGDQHQTWELSEFQLGYLSLGTKKPLLCTVELRGDENDSTLESELARYATIWDAAKNPPHGVTVRHPLAINDLDLSPDNSLLASGSDDRTVKIWRAESGKLASPPLAHEGVVSTVRFDRSGRRVLTLDDYGFRVWSAPRGDQLTPVIAPGEWIHDQQLIGDRLLVATTAAQPSDIFPNWLPSPLLLRSWDLSPTEKSLEELELLARVLSGHEIDANGGFVPLSFEQRERTWQSYLEVRSD